MKHQTQTDPDLPPQGANKWEVLRELAAARIAFGLSDRDMSVLQALVSFHPGTVLGGNDADLIVHPSNRAICERLNGMPCSTMRRHLSHLVAAGIVLRRDSPNGKRYARRHGAEKIVFGFDLAPLVARLAEFAAAAEEIRAAAERLKRLREIVSLMRRDLAGLAEYGATVRPDLPVWDRLADLAALTARALRRQLGVDELSGFEASLGAALEEARDILDAQKSETLSTNGDHNEHHYQNSKSDSHDSEPCCETTKGGERHAANAEAVLTESVRERLVTRNPGDPHLSPDLAIRERRQESDSTPPGRHGKSDASGTIDHNDDGNENVNSTSSVRVQDQNSAPMPDKISSDLANREREPKAMPGSRRADRPGYGPSGQGSRADGLSAHVPPRHEPDGVVSDVEGVDCDKRPNVPLGLVLASCPEIHSYAEGRIRHWHDLVKTAETVRPLMGISPSAWDDARDVMGSEEAAVVVAGMLERFAEIRSPGGYLRRLTEKAARDAFSCGPMIMALLRRNAA